MSCAIVPAILAISENEYAEKLKKVENSLLPKDNWIQLDLMDNKFVKNQSIDSTVVKKYPTNYKIEAHLMVEDPYFWASELKEFKISRFIAPIELEEEVLDRFIAFVRAFDLGDIGFSINPDTPVDKIIPYQNVADSILVMSVFPGYGGQEFIENSIERVKRISTIRQENYLHFLIGVDGGINENNVLDLINAGADYLVIGSRILEGDLDANIRKIREAFQS